MPDTEDGYLGAIAAAPHDNAVRLEFADWLRDKGDPRGEFLRAHCELASLPAVSPDRAELTRRVADLQKKRHAEAIGALKPLGVRDLRFDRGFVDRIEVEGTQFVDRWRTMQAWAPALRGIKLRPASNCDLGLGVRKLLLSPRFVTVTALDLSACSLSRKEVEQVAGAAGLARVATLNLSRNLISGEGMRTFGGSHFLGGLETLRIAECQLSAHDVAWLAQSDSLKSLKRLDVSSNAIGDEGFTSLVCSRNLINLCELNAAKNDIGSDGVRAFCTASPLKGLESLNLADNWIGDPGASLLASASNCARLTTLNLDRCGVEAEGEQALRSSTWMTRIEKLSVAPSPGKRPRM